MTINSKSLALRNLGAVVIGRNEGSRLAACLDSLISNCHATVYVDSGSMDDSVALARARGVEVVALDLSRPFTAARARNAGFTRLIEQNPTIEFVQFVDGDCEVVSGWLSNAHAFLTENPGSAVACGRRRERFPNQSIYNKLCDIEWDTPVGQARACGGDAMIRAAHLQQVDGYDETVIAGEEPELCVRLRKAGYQIHRLDAEMTLHDAALSKFSQWWKRNVRSGHAFAEGAHMHGAPPEQHFVKEERRAWFWGAAVPVLAIGGALPTLGFSTLLLAGYPVSAGRIYRHFRKRGKGHDESALAGVFLTIGKFAEVQGSLRYHLGRLAGRRSEIIEYKSPNTQEPKKT
jgi:GT2 family glycosyltransferase